MNGTENQMKNQLPVTFILIHGFCQGGWIWKLVAERLRALGHNVLSPSLDGCAERAGQLRAGIDTENHGEEIAKLLYFNDLRDVVLVGTSSGGMVLACAAEQARERVARIVFVDALALFDGEKLCDFVAPPGSITTPLAHGPTRDEMAEHAFNNLDPALRDWAADRITPCPLAVLNQPVKLGRFWDLPWDASALYCSQSPHPGEAHVRRSAEKLHARFHVLDTFHYPMLSAPDALTDFIVSG
jgi:pimeloyl-ACP methyl ester carboxylesterase